MGSIAHFRQAMLDADHYQKLNAYYEAHGGSQPPFDPALKALLAARTKKLPVWWESNTRDEIHRALDLADEFGTTAVIVGGREAAKVADRLKSAKVPVVLRLNFPEEPRVPTEEEYRKKAAAERDEPLRVLAHRKAKWKEQVATAAALAKAGVPFAFATEGIERIDSFPAVVRQLITAGLAADDALAGLTKNAAAIAGVDSRLGTLEPGKLGHVIAMTAPFNDEKAKVKYVLIDGLKFEIKPEDRARTKSRAGGGPDGLASAGEPGDRPRFGGRGAGGRGLNPDDDETPEPAERKRTPDRPDQKAKQEPATARAPTTRNPAPPEAPTSRNPDQEERRRRRQSQSEAKHGRQGRRYKTDSDAQTKKPEPPRQRPRKPKRQAEGRAGRLRLSTCRPSSTTIASRRSTPAATCSSRARRS